MRRNAQWPNATLYLESRICRARKRPRVASLTRWAMRSFGTASRQWRRIASVPASGAVRLVRLVVRVDIAFLKHSARAPLPTKPGLARVSHDSAQVGQARLAVGRGWGWGWCEKAHAAPHVVNDYPPPQPSPTRGEGADRVCGAVVH